MAVGLVPQRNRNFAGSLSRWIVLRRNIVERKQADLCARQSRSSEEHRISITCPQQTPVRSSGGFQVGSQYQRRPQSFFELRASHY